MLHAAPQSIIPPVFDQLSPPVRTIAESLRNQCEYRP
jgi:hypothetical protein